MSHLKKSMRWSLTRNGRTFITYGIWSTQHLEFDSSMFPPGEYEIAPAGYYSREKNIIVDDPYPVTMQDGRAVWG